MIGELGHFALWLALGAALAQAALGLLGPGRGDRPMMVAASRAAIAQGLLVAFSFGCLAASFVNGDFSLVNVARNSNSQLPVAYRIAASWGSHEGSILLWSLMLAGWTSAVAMFGKTLSTEVRSRVIGVLALISIGFIGFTLLTSNPFDRAFPVPADGNDLNPLLQDPGMVIHPPMLYMGYVGFSVAFAFAIAALIGGRVDAAWTRWTRPWTTAAWSFLTVGIALGSGWAYYELGWGGWWFWDPVENASFMPWLAGTALIHSLVVTERRGAFKAWTLLLAIGTFSLSLLGTFLVRSGVLTSVHAFATDPARGIFILGFLVIVVGGSLALFAWRAPMLSGNGRSTGVTFAASSREGYLLANNVLMTVAAAAVFLGTLYPLLLDTLGLGKISVGPPYFEAVFFPLMAPAVFLMGVGPLARWREAPVPDLGRRLRWAFVVALLTTAIVRFSTGVGGWRFVIGVAIGAWLVVATLVALVERLRDAGGQGIGVGTRLAALPAGFWGMTLAHLGVGVFVLGVAGVNTLHSEADHAVRIGERFTLGERTFTLRALTPADGPNYQATRGTVEVVEPGGRTLVLHPEKRRYNVQQSVMTEAAIDVGFLRDVYVSLGEPLADGRWTVKAWVKPLIDWIWAGCLLMAVGGFVALSDRRYRSALVRSPRPAAGAVDPLATGRTG
jgi:cytochrome c-type biogenesis protein CcmF